MQMVYVLSRNPIPIFRVCLHLLSFYFPPTCHSRLQTASRESTNRYQDGGEWCTRVPQPSVLTEAVPAES
jgi:hypothetical protein